MARRTEKPTFKHRCEAIALFMAGWLFTRLPHNLALALARAIGTVGSFTGIRASVVRENIESAFGDSMTASRKMHIFREAYRSLCLLAVEGFFLEHRSTQWVRSQITLRGEENVAAAKSDPRGFIFLSGHLGNWEYLGAWGEEINPCTTLAKSLHNPIVQARVEKTRRRHGLEIIWADKPDALRRISQTIRSDRRLNVLADQDAGVEGLFVPFLGKPASTTPTPALLAIRHNMPILAGYAIRDGRRRHIAHFCPLLDPDDLPPGTREEQIAELTARHVAQLEKLVRQNPEQYFWFHRRWKTTPEHARQKLEKRRRKKLAKIQALQSLTGDSPENQGQT